MFRNSISLSLFALALLPGLAPGGDRAFHFTLIDYPNATTTIANGINSKGDIVGVYTNSLGTHAFILRDGVFTNFDYPGAAYTDARGINPGGDVIGTYRMPGEPAVNFHGYLLQRDGALLPIDYPGQLNTIAQRILPDGSVVGCYHGTDMMASMHGFVYTGGQYSPLVTDPDQIGTMNNGATPNLGVVVGLYFDMMLGKSRAYTVQNGVFTPFDYPLATLTSAWDVNPSGAIVGVYVDNLGRRHAFLWENGDFTSLDAPGGTLTVAFGINSGGDIVGRAGSHGFLATRTQQHNK